jgi:hypothetical protein
MDNYKGRASYYRYSGQDATRSAMWMMWNGPSCNDVEYIVSIDSERKMMVHKASVFGLLVCSLLACNLPFATDSGSPHAEFAFPRQRATEGEREVMEAQLFGSLIADGMCLRVDSGTERYLIIWPPNYSLAVRDGAIIILDASGNLAVEVGQQVYISGGEVPLTQHSLDEANVEGLADSGCAGPYWFAGDIVEPHE